MAPLDIVKFLTQDFPGETKKILSFNNSTWRKVLEVDYPYVAYASLRAPLLFVDSKTIDRCCPQRYCFSPGILETLGRALAEIPEEPEAVPEMLEKVDWAISEEARRDRERYWRFVALACYCPDINGHFPQLSYRGPAILICPERLEERVEAMMKKGEEDPLLYVLRGVYTHEVAHSYIDAWSTNRSPSRIPLSRNRRADEFYHAVLEESIATALEVGNFYGWRSFLERAYAAYLLKNLPVEYLGFHCLINRLRDLGLSRDSLGELPEKYSLEGESPPAWAISLRMLPTKLRNAPPGSLEWVIRCLLRRHIMGLELKRCFEVLKALLERTYGTPLASRILWKLAALYWLLEAPKKYRSPFHFSFELHVKESCSEFPPLNER